MRLVDGIKDHIIGLIAEVSTPVKIESFHALKILFLLKSYV